MCYCSWECGKFDYTHLLLSTWTNKLPMAWWHVACYSIAYIKKLTVILIKLLCQTDFKGKVTFYSILNWKFQLGRVRIVRVPSRASRMIRGRALLGRLVNEELFLDWYSINYLWRTGLVIDLFRAAAIPDLFVFNQVKKGDPWAKKKLRKKSASARMMWADWETFQHTAASRLSAMR